VTLDVSSRLGAVRHQGRRLTCVAFATSDLHAAVRSAPFAPLSVEYLYYNACRLSTPFDPHSGVTLDQILGAVETNGQPEEEHWPYLDQIPTNLNDYRPPAISAPIYRRTGQAITGSALDQIAKELQAGRPSMLVFRSSLNLMQAKPDAPVRWSSTDQWLNAHAVLAVALGNDRSERFVRVRNSWGTGWADAGHAWLTEEYVQKTFINLIRMV
jgi:Papain family cysteine protease